MLGSSGANQTKFREQICLNFGLDARCAFVCHRDLPLRLLPFGDDDLLFSQVLVTKLIAITNI